MLDVLAALALLVVSHEGGHFLTALISKAHPKMRFMRSEITVPWLGWKIPMYTIVTLHDASDALTRRLIAMMGFGGSLLVALELWLLLNTPGAWVSRSFGAWFSAWLALHFITYPAYMMHSPYNDFNYLGTEPEETGTEPEETGTEPEEVDEDAED